MIKLTKKAVELLDAVTSVPYSRKGLGYTIRRGLDAVCYIDQRGKLMKALLNCSVMLIITMLKQIYMKHRKIKLP
jgi:hypothetical protein